MCSHPLSVLQECWGPPVHTYVKIFGFELWVCNFNFRTALLTLQLSLLSWGSLWLLPLLEMFIASVFQIHPTVEQLHLSTSTGIMLLYHDVPSLWPPGSPIPFPALFFLPLTLDIETTCYMWVKRNMSLGGVRIWAQILNVPLSEPRHVTYPLRPSVFSWFKWV
jgi:hypothetical protein